MLFSFSCLKKDTNEKVLINSCLVLTHRFLDAVNYLFLVLIFFHRQNSMYEVQCVIKYTVILE
jgi:hypothetical protein